MRSMTGREIRQLFLDFFAGRGHEVVPSSPLLPAGDSTLLFANAGMNQFKDVFAGRERRSYSRACSSQKCVRAGGKHNDLENVGYTARHHTFFEMLGNFSFGDYFKREAIRYAWDLLVGAYGLPVERLWFTVYTDDDEAAELWAEIGAPRDRILRFGEKDNCWSMGETGPCGPCSEIHYDRGADPTAAGRGELVNGEGDDIVEIWNLVFMQYERDADGRLHPLPRPSIDTGAGLERLAAVLQGGATNYDTDLFLPILGAIGELVGRPYDPRHELGPAYRVIADHVRATTFLMTDGVVPSNEGRGYVLRRIVRRALRYGRKLGLDGAFLHTLVPTVVELMGDAYPELRERSDAVIPQLEQEEVRFARTLNAGTDVAQKELERLKRAGEPAVPGRTVFDLYQTHGIPVELLEEFAQEEGLVLDHEGFEAALDAERQRGQASWKGDVQARFRPVYEDLLDNGVTSAFIGYEQLEMHTEVVGLVGADGEVASLGAGESGEAVLEETPFYAESGGQVGDTGELTWEGGGRAIVTDTHRPLEGLIVHKVRVAEGTLRVNREVLAKVTEGTRLDTQRNHTATHLLHAALREVLGPAAQQAGSLVEPDRLRFDFSWGGPVETERLEEIERLVNHEIVTNHSVTKQFMRIDAARQLGAVALFGEKYGDTVRVVTIGDGQTSRELCGGCHVQRTGDIGLFRIVSERGVAAGVRRIEAVTGRGAVAWVQRRARLGDQLAARYQTSFERLPEVVEARERRLAELEEEIRTLKHRLASGDGGGEVRTEVAGIPVLTRKAPAMSPSDLRNLADTLRQRLGTGVVVLGMESDHKATLLVAVTDDVLERVHAGHLVRELAPMVGGRGGGRPNLAQAGGPDADKLDDALRRAPEVLAALLG